MWEEMREMIFNFAEKLAIGISTLIFIAVIIAAWLK